MEAVEAINQIEIIKEEIKAGSKKLSRNSKFSRYQMADSDALFFASHIIDCIKNSEDALEILELDSFKKDMKEKPKKTRYGDNRLKILNVAKRWAMAALRRKG